MNDLLVADRLAGHASARSRQCLPPLLRDQLSAVVRSFARFQASPYRLDSIPDRVVNLVLRRAVARPSAGHILSPYFSNVDL